jgi:AraC family transcriptional regulator
MEHQSTRVLVDTEVARVFDVFCRAPRSGYGPAELNSVAQVGLPRRGVFVLERRGSPIVVDPNTAIVLGRDDEYRVSHPTADGDEGTVVVLPPQLLEDAVGGVEGRVGTLRPHDHLAVCMVTRALRDLPPDDLEAEEATVLLLASVSHAFSEAAENRPWLGRPQRLRIEQARALLASSPGTRWELARLGKLLRCSPFHLARQFHALTGETIARYLLRLRLALAVERLADGERDLSMLAIETGFANHSHFTARFRRTFGITPRQAREMLTGRRLAELRVVLGESPRNESRRKLRRD